MTGERRSAVVLAAIALATSVGCASRPKEPAIVHEPTSSPAPSAVATAPGGPWPALALTEAWAGVDQPLGLTGAGDGSERVFILEKTGRVRVARGGRLLAEPYLDLSGEVSADSERGLLGLAFSPDFERTGRFYVNYTDRSGSTVVERFAVPDPGADSAAGARRGVLLRIGQPYPNHNGGCLAFGPDRMLYVGTGDGGGAGDPDGNAQDLGSLLGKLLRLDVGEAGARLAEGEAYRVPGDNPFAPASSRGTPGARPEIWAYGLRNPWRFSFDRATGDLWIGDVGQSAWEEIDLQRAGSVGGQNYGWDRFEASHPYPPGATQDPSGLVAPVVEYGHSAGRSVTGGVVYRGVAHPALAGIYLYGDFVTGRVWGLRSAQDGEWETRELLATSLSISSFGQDDSGEVYLCDLRGKVFRLTAR